MLTQDQLIEEIERYEPFERVKIVDAVLRDVVGANPEIEMAWREEATQRWKSYKQGDIESIPYDEVMAKYRKHL